MTAKQIGRFIFIRILMTILTLACLTCFFSCPFHLFLVRIITICLPRVLTLLSFFLLYIYELLVFKNWQWQNLSLARIFNQSKFFFFFLRKNSRTDDSFEDVAGSVSEQLHQSSFLSFVTQADIIDLIYPEPMKWRRLWGRSTFGLSINVSKFFL